MSDKQFAWLLAQLDAIPHLSRLRIHSRLPIVLPSRISPEWLDILSASRLDKVLVIHANHPNELDESVRAALQRAAAIGVMLLNQSVLLAGVNDDAKVLADLSRALLKFGVLPYYLHLLDKVDGAAHFAVADDKAQTIKAQLLATLPGYLVPRLVRELAGAASKTPFKTAAILG